MKLVTMSKNTYLGFENKYFKDIVQIYFILELCAVVIQNQ